MWMGCEVCGVSTAFIRTRRRRRAGGVNGLGKNVCQ